MHDHHHDHHHAHDQKTSFSNRAVDWDKNPEHVSASKSAFEAISSKIQLSKDMKVLEVGCGTGLLSVLLAPHVDSLLGVDTAPGMVDVFTSKVGPASEGKVPNMMAKEILLEDPDHPALGGQRFDLAVSHLTLHHIPDLVSFLTVIKQTLSPGGRVAFTDFEDDGPNAVRFHDPSIVKSHGVHRHGISITEIKDQLEKVGFSDISVERAWSMKKALKHEEGKEAEVNAVLETEQPEDKGSSRDSRIRVEGDGESSKKSVTDYAFDAMLSYQWSHQKTVLRVKQSLESRSFKIWMDLANIRGNINDSITDALILHQASYNCKKELNFAHAKEKQMVVVQLDNGPFTWSHALTSRCPLVDLGNSNLDDWETTIDTLAQDIRNMMAAARNSLEGQLNNNPDIRKRKEARNESHAYLKDLEQWLLPEGPKMENEVKEILLKKMDGTREWLLQEITNWFHDPKSRAYWLKGVAGVGKSVVAAMAWSQFRETGRLLGYFIGKHGNASRCNPDRLLATLAFQFAQKFPSVAMRLRQLQKNQPNIIAESSLYVKFKCLLVDPLAHLTDSERLPVVVIVEALDECALARTSQRKSLLHIISRWSEMPDFVKLLVTSRPESDIEESLSEFKPRWLDLSDSSQRRDLQIFANARMKAMKHRLKKSSEEIEELAEKLAASANGLFMWLFLACEDIRRSLTPLAVLERLVESEQGEGICLDQKMDSMYLSTLRRIISSRNESELDILKQVLGCIVCVKEPISHIAISELLKLDIDVVGSVLGILRPVLNITDDSVQTLHKSFSDFITNLLRCTDEKLFFDMRQLHQNFAIICLELIAEKSRPNIASMTPGVLHTEIDNFSELIFNRVSPGLAYSCCNFVRHLEDGGIYSDWGGAAMDSLSKAIDTFIRSKLLNYIEIMSILEKLHICTRHMKRFSSWVQDLGSDKELSTILEDGIRMMQSFYPAISACALEVYGTGLPFSPLGCPLYKQYFPLIETQSSLVIPKVIVGGVNEWQSCLSTLSGHEDEVNAVLWCKTTNLIFSSSKDKLIKSWDPATGTEVGKLIGHKDSIAGIDIAADGKSLMSFSERDIKLWELPSGSLQKTVECQKTVSTAIFHPTQKAVLWTSNSGHPDINFICTETGASLGKLPTGHEDWINAITISRSGKWMATSGHDLTVAVWQLNGITAPFAKRVKVLEGYPADVLCATFGVADRVLATGTTDHQVWIWDLFHGIGCEEETLRKSESSNENSEHDKPIKPVMILRGHHDKILSVACHPTDETILASSSKDASIRLWNLLQGTTLMRFNGHSRPVSSICFSPDGALIVSGSVDKTIKLWDALSRGDDHEGAEHDGQVTCIEFSPDGLFAFSGSTDRTIMIWDVESGAHVSRLGHQLPPGKADFHSSGFKSGGKATSHTDSITCIACSEDGRFLASGSDDMTVMIWDLLKVRDGEKQRPRLHLRGHSRWIRHVVFNPEGTAVVSIAEDYVRAWSLDSGKEIRRKSLGVDPDQFGIIRCLYGSLVMVEVEEKHVYTWNFSTGKYGSRP
ncbi:hypothetical protein HDU67_002199 [Dinochytrium kinnereticum]|nr:hypothetical protein HDU67_002199 [Dinochytrium kinnereticum]